MPITDSYTVFCERYKKIANISHTPKQPTNFWHFGTGPGKWGMINTKRCLEKKCGFMSASHASGMSQLKNFKDNAVEGDKLFLHVNQKISYIGNYTGEIIQHGVEEACCKYLMKMRWINGHQEVIQRWLHDPNDFDARETPWFPKGATSPVDHEYSIMVDDWKKIDKPFPGLGKRLTIYKAPEYGQRI